MWIAQKCFNELKDLEINKITDLNNVGKTYAFVVCYGRIFHSNDQIGKLEIKSFLGTLTSEEKKMHSSLMDMRNQSFAHNDPQHNNLFVSYNKDKSKINAIAQFSYHPLSYYKETISALLNKVINMLEAERDSLITKLYIEQKTHPISEKKAYSVYFHSGFIEQPISDKG